LYEIDKVVDEALHRADKCVTNTQMASRPTEQADISEVKKTAPASNSAGEYKKAIEAEYPSDASECEKPCLTSPCLLF
jgi:hypothetical protein